jgi:hypothetical protein
MEEAEGVGSAAKSAIFAADLSFAGHFLSSFCWAGCVGCQYFLRVGRWDDRMAEFRLWLLAIERMTATMNLIDGGAGVVTADWIGFVLSWSKPTMMTTELMTKKSALMMITMMDRPFGWL